MISYNFYLYLTFGLYLYSCSVNWKTIIAIYLFVYANNLLVTHKKKSYLFVMNIHRFKTNYNFFS